MLKKINPQVAAKINQSNKKVAANINRHLVAVLLHIFHLSFCFHRQNWTLKFSPHKMHSTLSTVATLKWKCQMPNFSRYASLSYSRWNPNSQNPEAHVDRWLGSHMTEEGVILSQSHLVHNLGKWGEESRGPQSQSVQAVGTEPAPKQEYQDPKLQMPLLLECKRSPDSRFANPYQSHHSSVTQALQNVLVRNRKAR